MRKLFLLPLLFCFLFKGFSQTISYTVGGSSYTQSFDGLINTGNTNSLVNGPLEISNTNFLGSNVPGWYAERYAGTGTGINFGADAGTGSGGSIFSYGAGTNLDRALGMLASGSRINRVGALFTNNTGGTLNSITISFTGEQWRRGNGSANILSFFYKIGATAINDGTGYAAVTNLNFTAPITTGSDVALVGNTAANRTIITFTITGINWASGAVLGIRWDDVNDSGNDDGLGIDDFSLSAAAAVGNSITTGLVSTSPFCVDAVNAATGSVDFTSMGTFSNATFTALLSDAAGSFASPTSIGSALVSGTNPSVTIGSLTIPAGTASGTGYRIRVDASSPAVTGSASASFTIINGVPNVTGFAATAADMQVLLAYTLPTACFDEILIIAKANTTVAGIPTGNGTAYTANPIFGMGTGFDGGFVVYKGGISPQVVTALTNGTTYFFRTFIRRGTAWSAGVEVSAIPIAAPALTEVFVPQFIQGNSGTNNTRIPYIYRVTLSNLLPNATYRFIHSVVINADAANATGAGNCIFYANPGSFTSSSGPSLSSAGNYGTFTTNASGAYTGWFITEPSGNTRFAVGNNVFLRIILNDGGTGTTAATFLTTTSSATVINFGTTANSTTLGTGLRIRTFANPRDVVYFYDNTSGTGRPITGGYVENEGLDQSSTTFVGFYDLNVDGVDNQVGVIIPNNLPNGIRSIRAYTGSSAAASVSVADADGIWVGLSTINPTGGTTPIILGQDDAENLTVNMPITLNSPITVSNSLDFNGNIITTNSPNVITLNTNASLLNAGPTGFVNGPLVRFTNANMAYSFPIGKAGLYRPISVTPIDASASIYSSEFFNTPFGMYNACSPRLTSIANDVYWDISKITGANASISINYGTYGTTWSGGSGPTANDVITIAHRDLANNCWKDEGGNVATNTATNQLLTTAPIAAFSPFSFGFGPAVILPVNFGGIKATQVGATIKIDWSNLTETKVQHYEVERSLDAIQFYAIGRVSAVLNNNQKADYSLVDGLPLLGINYYRIKAIENNGSFKYSSIAKVDVSKTGVAAITVYPNPIKENQFSLLATNLPLGGYTVKVLNAIGQQVYTQNFTHAGGFITKNVQLPISTNAGFYNVIITNNQQINLKQTVFVEGK